MKVRIYYNATYLLKKRSKGLDCGLDVMEGGTPMGDSVWIWPSADMNFWKINNEETSVIIKWSRNYFKDYKALSYHFYECGYQTFADVIKSGHDNFKSDMWFLTCIFLLRHSIELGLKSLLCRVLPRKRDIQNSFEDCCHDVSMLLKKYIDIGRESFLTNEETEWLTTYLDSLEEVDKKSDMFRFPFEDDFLSKYRDKFLDNVDVANNLLQAFALVKKCIEKGIVSEEYEFDHNLKPEFFVFASHGFGNCYLRQRISDEGFHVKVTGYTEVIDYIYKNHQILNKVKLYPLIFMFRNTIELCLKRLFYSRVEDGVLLKVFNSNLKSHYIKKNLWKNVKPIIVKYANDSGENLAIVDIVEKLLDEINSLDKKGDMFRYPTSYSLEYRNDNKKMDLSNVYMYLKSIINFLEGCDFMLDAIADYESAMKAEY